MGSKKKKAEKKKDFTKAKLKVGKTARKPDNYTDTSFTARSISLPNQSIGKAGPKPEQGTEKKGDVDLTHHLSLTKHHSNTTRKEVLAYIESHLPSNPSEYKHIITAVTPLITDLSMSVRNAVASLLAKCGEKQPGLLQLHIRPLALFVNSSMSSIHPDIRNSSTKFLNVLIEHAREPLVNLYLIKILKSFFTLMAWTLKQDKQSVSLAVTTSASIGGPSKKARIDHLKALGSLMRIAFFSQDQEGDDIYHDVVCVHAQSHKYMMTNVPLVYAPLKLFVQTFPNTAQVSGSNDGFDDGKYTIEDLDQLTTEDIDTRRKMFQDVFEAPMVKNLNSLVKEGGEVGREAHTCLELIERLQK